MIDIDSSADEKKIRQAAMNLLARREHSLFELKDKLCQKFDNSDSVTMVANRLRSENLQSDSRYVENFVRTRIARGQGLMKIEAELFKKGIEEGLLKKICLDMKIDWKGLARRVASRKVINRKPSNQIERSKVIRFLQSRGFTLGEAMEALNDCGLD